MADIAKPQVGKRGWNTAVDAVIDKVNALSATLLTATGDGVTDDTTAINAALAAGGAGSVIRGAPGKTYLISAPLVLRAGGQQTLDMTGCTITLKAASSCNMLNNAAVASARTVMDAVTTAASTALTSATAAFTGGDVGKQVFVWGAGVDGEPLDTTIASVTDASTVVLASAATSALTGATASIGTRDTGLTVRGGTWNRGANAGTNTNLHTLRFRRVDGFLLEDVTVTSTAGKYVINFGDVTKLHVSRPTVASASDGVHINGPAAQVTISGVRGRSGDDTVALTANDYVNYADTSGPISRVTIRDVDAVSSKMLVKILAGLNCTVRSVFVDGVRGVCATAGVGAVSDGGSANTVGADIDGVFLRNLAIRPVGSTGVVELLGVGLGAIDIDGITSLNATSTGIPLVNIVGSGTTIDRVVVRSVQYRHAVGNRLVYVQAGTVQDLIVGDVLARQNAANVGEVVNVAAPATVTAVRVENIRQFGGLSVVGHAGTIGTITLVSVQSTGAHGVVNSGTASVNVYAHGCTFSGSPGNIARLTGGAGCGAIVRGGASSVAGAAVSPSTTQTARVIGADLRADIGVLTPAAGDLVYNTDATEATGAGLSLYTGTVWKNLQV